MISTASFFINIEMKLDLDRILDIFEMMIESMQVDHSDLNWNEFFSGIKDVFKLTFITMLGIGIAFLFFLIAGNFPYWIDFLY